MMSSTAIWMTVPVKLAAARAGAAGSSSPSTFRWISRVLLNSRKPPPPIRIRSRHEKPCPASDITGSVRRMSQAIEPSSASRVANAKARPTLRAPALRARQAARQQRQEHQVVDAKDDFQRDEAEEASPDVGIHRARSMAVNRLAREARGGSAAATGTFDQPLVISGAERHDPPAPAGVISAPANRTRFNVGASVRVDAAWRPSQCGRCRSIQARTLRSVAVTQRPDVP